MNLNVTFNFGPTTYGSSVSVPSGSSGSSGSTPSGSESGSIDLAKLTTTAGKIVSQALSGKEGPFGPTLGNLVKMAADGSGAELLGTISNVLGNLVGSESSSSSVYSEKPISYTATITPDGEVKVGPPPETPKETLAVKILTPFIVDIDGLICDSFIKMLTPMYESTFADLFTEGISREGVIATAEAIESAFSTVSESGVGIMLSGFSEIREEISKVATYTKNFLAEHTDEDLDEVVGALKDGVKDLIHFIFTSTQPKYDWKKFIRFILDKSNNVHVHRICQFFIDLIENSEKSKDTIERNSEEHKNLSSSFGVDMTIEDGVLKQDPRRLNSFITNALASRGVTLGREDRESEDCQAASSNGDSSPFRTPEEKDLDDETPESLPGTEPKEYPRDNTQGVNNLIQAALNITNVPPGATRDMITQMASALLSNQVPKKSNDSSVFEE